MIYDSSRLRELEDKELELKAALEVIQRKIRGRFKLLPTMYIDSSDEASTYKEGDYTISLSETSADALSEIKSIESNRELTIITLKSGERIVFEDYFSKDAINSMVRIKQVIVHEDHFKNAVPFGEL